MNCNCIYLKDFKKYGIKNNPFIIRKLKAINKINWSNIKKIRKKII